VTSSRESASPADAWLVKEAKPGSRPDPAAKSEERSEPAESDDKAVAQRQRAENSEWVPGPGASSSAKASRQKRRKTRANGVQQTSDEEKQSAEEAAVDPRPVPDPYPGDTEKALSERVAMLEKELRSARQELSASEKESGEGRTSKRLAKAEETIKQQREERAELMKRIRELQTELRRQTKRVDAEVKQALRERKAELAALKAELAQAKPATRPAPPRGGARKANRLRGSRSNGALDLNQATFEELRSLGLSVTQSARLIAYRDVNDGYKSLQELDDIGGLSEKTRRLLKDQLMLGE
jgi:DNA uptake protein ComE-like DNA-binding protein